MKNFCIIHVLLLLLLMIIYQVTKAQEYVLTQRGDSVAGNIKILSYGPEKKVQVTTADKKKTLYAIFQVKSFFIDNEKYATVKGSNGYAFMKVIKEGYLSLYAFQIDKQLTYDGLLLQKKDGATMEVPNLTFKKQMAKFLNDCATLTEKLDKGELGKRDLGKIVDEYNGCISRNTNQVNKVVAEKKEEPKAINVWDDLETKISAKDFENKNDALDMIKEIKNKIRNSEKVPNFLMEGLKRSLGNTDLNPDLEAALKTLN
jgi:hypothetical protein